MKNISKKICLALFTAALSSMAQAGSLDEVKIRQISYGGPGCKQGTVGELLASDKQSFTLLFDDFIASIGPGIERKENRKFCQISLELFVPQGWSYTVGQFDYRGYASLDRGVTATQTARYYFDSASEGKFSSEIRGPESKDYLFTDRIGLESVVWSRCGDTKLLNIKTEISLRSSRSSASGMITTDSIDGKVSHKFGLQWRRC